MKRLYAYLKNKYFHENLDLRIQSFNLLTTWPAWRRALLSR
jgi:hypothetical protein